MHEPAMRMSLRVLPFSAVCSAWARSCDSSSVTSILSGLRALSGPAHAARTPMQLEHAPSRAWTSTMMAGAAFPLMTTRLSALNRGNVQARPFSTVPVKKMDDEEREALKLKRLLAAKERRAKEKTTIRATARAKDCLGTTASVALRKTGYVPGRLQDSNGTNELLAVLSKSVRRWCIEARATSTVFQLCIDDRPPMPVLIRELQAHYVHYDEPMHVTLLKYEEGVDYEIEIPVNLVNQDKSPGLRIGGALNLNMRTIKVKIAGGTPIPQRIEVDLAGLKVGDRIFLRDVQMPGGIEIADLPHYKTISLLRIAKTRASMGLV